MGVRDGKMRGVNPCSFLNSAYGFFQELRRQIWPDDRGAQLPEWDFFLRRKAGERERSCWGDWLLLGRYLSFPSANEKLGRPIPETFWNSLPLWGNIFAQTEETLLDEEIAPSPYGDYYPGTEIMDPAWPLQRYRLIQKMRYMTVPLKIRTREYDRFSHTVNWRDYAETYPRSINKDSFYWNGRDNEGQYVQIEAQIPEYWAQGNTVCKIGLEGGWKYSDSRPPPPIDGCAWHNGTWYLSGEYTGLNSSPGIVRLFGAADLATHPDFARYFDVNE